VTGATGPQADPPSDPESEFPGLSAATRITAPVSFTPTPPQATNPAAAGTSAPPDAPVLATEVPSPASGRLSPDGALSPPATAGMTLASALSAPAPRAAAAAPTASTAAAPGTSTPPHATPAGPPAPAAPGADMLSIVAQLIATQAESNAAMLRAMAESQAEQLREQRAADTTARAADTAARVAAEIRQAERHREERAADLAEADRRDARYQAEIQAVLQSRGTNTTTTTTGDTTLLTDGSSVPTRSIGEQHRTLKGAFTTGQMLRDVSHPRETVAKWTRWLTDHGKAIDPHFLAIEVNAHALFKDSEAYKLFEAFRDTQPANHNLTVTEICAWALDTLVPKDSSLVSAQAYLDATGAGMAFTVAASRLVALENAAFRPDWLTAIAATATALSARFSAHITTAELTELFAVTGVTMTPRNLADLRLSQQAAPAIVVKLQERGYTNDSSRAAHPGLMEKELHQLVLAHKEAAKFPKNAVPTYATAAAVQPRAQPRANPPLTAATTTTTTTTDGAEAEAAWTTVPKGKSGKKSKQTAKRNAATAASAARIAYLEAQLVHADATAGDAPSEVAAFAAPDTQGLAESFRVMFSNPGKPPASTDTRCEFCAGTASAWGNAVPKKASTHCTSMCSDLYRRLYPSSIVNVQLLAEAQALNPNFKQ
jgi:hypothetical protein